MQVEIDPQRHQEIGRFAEPLGILAGQCIGHSRRCHRRFAGLNKLQPVHQLDVAQSPRRSLHIRLQKRHALPVAIPFLPPGLKQLRHEALRHPAGQSFEAGRESIGEKGIARERSHIDERTEYRRIARGQPHCLADGAHALPDLHPGRRRFVENHQIDVGEGGHLATAIAAVGHECHLLLELRRIGSAQLRDQRPPHIIDNLV